MRKHIVQATLDLETIDEDRSRILSGIGEADHVVISIPVSSGITSAAVQLLHSARKTAEELGVEISIEGAGYDRLKSIAQTIGVEVA